MNEVEANPDEIKKLLELLAGAPRRISKATNGVSNSRLMFHTEEEPWSIIDILAHLHASADVRERYIQAMLTQDDPTMRWVSPRTYIKKTNYLEVPFADSFTVYKKQRKALLATLKDLSLKGWSRSANIKKRSETVFS